MVLKWYILYINRGNLGNIPQEGGIFQTGLMKFDATMKFISKFGYFKIFFAFLVKYLHTNDDNIANQDILSSWGGYVFEENTTYVLSHNWFLTISGGCQWSKPVTAQQTSCSTS